ncbi:MAG: putative toxin-antitoxin system toxin component, PIN family [Bdellovibrionales bacterium]
MQSRYTYQEIVQKMNQKCTEGSLSEDAVRKYDRFIINGSTFIGVEPGITSCKDKTDNKFLDLAVTGKADYIISGDHHLLNMKNIRGIGHTVQIVSPAGFVALFENAQARPSSDLRLAPV